MHAERNHGCQCDSKTIYIYIYIYMDAYIVSAHLAHVLYSLILVECLGLALAFLCVRT